MNMLDNRVKKKSRENIKMTLVLLGGKLTNTQQMPDGANQITKKLLFLVELDRFISVRAEKGANMLKSQ